MITHNIIFVSFCLSLTFSQEINFQQAWNFFSQSGGIQTVIDQMKYAGTTLEEVGDTIKQVSDHYDIPNLLKKNLKIDDQQFRTLKDQVQPYWSMVKSAGWDQKALTEWDKVKKIGISDILNKKKQSEFAKSAAVSTYRKGKKAAQTVVKNYLFSLTEGLSEKCRDHVREYVSSFVYNNFTDGPGGNWSSEWAIRRKYLTTVFHILQRPLRSLNI